MPTIPVLSGPSLEPVSGNVRKVVILFHGYGADGHDLMSLAEYWSPALPDTEFIAPHAPNVCEQNSFGRQWFSMTDWTLDKILQGLKTISPVISTYIAHVLAQRELQLEDLALVGFSQGAMLALYQAYYSLDKCAGVISYSGAFLEDVAVAPKGLPPTLLIHGDADQVIPVEATIMATQTIKKMGGHPQTIIRNALTHGIDDEGLMQGQEFLQKVFGYASI